MLTYFCCSDHRALSSMFVSCELSVIIMSSGDYFFHLKKNKTPNTTVYKMWIHAGKGQEFSAVNLYCEKD